jgi:hypothetical protein
MTEELQKSAIFDTDKKYIQHLRNSIALLEGCVRRGEDVMINAPMATRILLDFYYETLRRTLLYGKEDNKES